MNAPSKTQALLAAWSEPNKDDLHCENPMIMLPFAEAAGSSIRQALEKPSRTKRKNTQRKIFLQKQMKRVSSASASSLPLSTTSSSSLQSATSTTTAGQLSQPYLPLPTELGRSCSTPALNSTILPDRLSPMNVAPAPSFQSLPSISTMNNGTDMLPRRDTLPSFHLADNTDSIETLSYSSSMTMLNDSDFQILLDSLNKEDFDPSTLTDEGFSSDCSALSPFSDIDSIPFSASNSAKPIISPTATTPGYNRSLYHPYQRQLATSASCSQLQSPFQSHTDLADATVFDWSMPQQSMRQTSVFPTSIQRQEPPNVPRSQPFQRVNSSGC